MVEMETLNFIGGVIFGTIVLSIIWAIIISAGRESKTDKSGIDLIGVAVLSFIVMLIIAVAKCASK